MELTIPSKYRKNIETTTNLLIVMVWNVLLYCFLSV
jgi:hypothetical protein